MKKIVILIFMLLPFFAIAQGNHELRHRYGVGLTITGKRNVEIVGLGIGPLPLWGPTGGGSLTVKGVNVELFPVAVFTIIGSMFGPCLSLFSKEFYTPMDYDTTDTHIYGVSISGGLFPNADVHGFSFNLVNSYAMHSGGLELSFFSNTNNSFKGVQASMWGNRSLKGKGVQIGFFNSCYDCQVLQIGLLNRSGRRILPLLNFRFKPSRPDQLQRF